MSAEPTTADMPDPEASLVLLRTGAEALIRTLGRKRGERFLRAWMELLAAEESVAKLLPIRPSAKRAALNAARAEAAAWIREVAPVLIAALPLDE